MKYLLLAFCLFFCLHCSSHYPPPKLVIIGLDAATFDMIDPLIHANKLPHFAELISQGAFCPLDTFEPTESPQIWTTIATGKSPAVHGITSFTRRIPGTDTTIPLHSSFRKCPAFWDIFSAQEKSVIAIKWWASYPAELARGAVISARLEDELPAGQTYPSTLYPQLTKFRLLGQIAKKHGVLSDPKSIPHNASGNLLPELKSTDAIVREQEPPFDDQSVAALGKYVLGKAQPDVFAIYFKSIDKIQHVNWEFRDYQHLSSVDKAAFKRGKSIEDMYVLFDKLVGEYMVIAGPNATFVLLSDHGMEATADIAEPYSIRSLNMDHLLSALGWYKRDDKTKTIWSETTAYQVFTNAYSYEFYLNLNILGREPQGVIAPADKQIKREELIHLLSSIRTVDDIPLFKTINGDTKSDADIVCRVNPAVELHHMISINGTNYRLKEWIDMMALPSGIHVHAPRGIFIAKGPGIKQNYRINRAEVFDVLPTLLYLGSLPVPLDLQGKVIEEMMLRPYISKHPVSSVETYDTIFKSRSAVLEANPGDEVIKSELRNMGYIR